MSIFNELMCKQNIKDINVSYKIVYLIDSIPSLFKPFVIFLIGKTIAYS